MASHDDSHGEGSSRSSGALRQKPGRVLAFLALVGPLALSATLPAADSALARVTIHARLDPGLAPTDCKVAVESLVEDFDKAIERALSSGLETTLHLDPSRDWNLRVSCRDLLAAPRVIGGARPWMNDESFRVRAGGELVGTLTDRDALPRLALEIQYEPSSAMSRHGIAAARLPCNSAAGKFSCTVPEGTFDARLTAKGFAPEYFWSMAAKAGAVVDVGQISLKKGASLAGWVMTDSAAGFSAPPTRVDLAPVTMGGWQRDPVGGARAALSNQRTNVTAAGFFQLTEVSGGTYSLRIERQGLAPTELEVHIPEGAEVFLDRPVLLQPPTDASVIVSPPTNWDGTPWQAALLRMPLGGNTYESVDAGPVGMDGSWRSRPVSPGEYVLSLSDRSGATWYRDSRVLDGLAAPWLVDLELVRIRGLVTMGDEPLACTLAFGTRNRIPNVLITSDDKGRFEGYLPHSGRWPLEILFGESRHQRAADVEVRDPSSGEPANLEIHLPASRVFGRVTANGKAVSDAIVVVVREVTDRGSDGGRQTRDASQRVDTRGGFEFLGLSSGAVLVRAYDAARTSPWVRTEIEEDRSGQGLRLELGDVMTVEGRLMGVNGPVGGGLIVPAAVLSDGQTIPLENRLSSADGSFELTVDKRTTALDLIAVVPGCGVEIGRHRIASESGTSNLTIVCAPPRGQVLLEAMGPDSTLSHGGASVPTGVVLAAADRGGFLPDDDRGFLLTGAGPGAYRFCVGPVCRDAMLAESNEVVFGPLEGASHASQ